jgi:hypothetical protein
MIKWFVDWAKAIYGGTKMWIKGDIQKGKL